MNKTISLLIASLIVSVPVFAHHGTSISYDDSKLVTFQATVTEFRFNNPHIQLFIDLKDENGKTVNWATEGESPRRYVAAGWTMKRSAELLKPGTEITITLAPSRSGTTAGLIYKILNKGEQVLSARAVGRGE